MVFGLNKIRNALGVSKDKNCSDDKSSDDNSNTYNSVSLLSGSGTDFFGISYNSSFDSSDSSLSNNSFQDNNQEKRDLRPISPGSFPDLEHILDDKSYYGDNPGFNIVFHGNPEIILGTLEFLLSGNERFFAKKPNKVYISGSLDNHQGYVQAKNIEDRIKSMRQNIFGFEGEDPISITAVDEVNIEDAINDSDIFVFSGNYNGFTISEKESDLSHDVEEIKRLSDYFSHSFRGLINITGQYPEVVAHVATKKLGIYDPRQITASTPLNVFKYGMLVSREIKGLFDFKGMRMLMKGTTDYAYPLFSGSYLLLESQANQGLIKDDGWYYLYGVLSEVAKRSNASKRLLQRDLMSNICSLVSKFDLVYSSKDDVAGGNRAEQDPNSVMPSCISFHERKRLYKELSESIILMNNLSVHEDYDPVTFSFSFSLYDLIYSIVERKQTHCSIPDSNHIGGGNFVYQPVDFSIGIPMPVKFKSSQIRSEIDEISRVFFIDEETILNYKNENKDGERAFLEREHHRTSAHIDRLVRFAGKDNSLSLYSRKDNVGLFKHLRTTSYQMHNFPYAVFGDFRIELSQRFNDLKDELNLYCSSEQLDPDDLECLLQKRKQFLIDCNSCGLPYKAFMEQMDIMLDNKMNQYIKQMEGILFSDKKWKPILQKLPQGYKLRQRLEHNADAESVGDFSNPDNHYRIYQPMGGNNKLGKKALELRLGYVSLMRTYLPKLRDEYGDDALGKMLVDFKRNCELMHNLYEGFMF